MTVVCQSKLNVSFMVHDDVMAIEFWWRRTELNLIVDRIGLDWRVDEGNAESKYVDQPSRWETAYKQTRHT